MTNWFSDPEATRTVALGDDWFKVRFPLSRADVARVTGLGELGDDEAVAAAIVEFVPEWSLTDASGEVRPVTPANFIALSLGGQTAIIEALTAAVADSITVPNASSAPSPASSRGSASRTRKQTPKPGT